jgi:DNA-binding transcriptional regulator LsrR (DeoR family)
MAVIDQDLMVAIAEDYYENTLSQQKIAVKYGISRMTVSNLLKRCKRDGIVEIRVNKRPSLAFALQRELQGVLKAEHVVLCQSNTETTHTRIIVGRSAADLLKRYLRDDLRIGMSYGSTLFETVNQLSVVSRYKNIEVLQLLGALGSKYPKQDGFELARALSEKLGGTYHIVQAPLVVQNSKLKQMLLSEPQIAETLKSAGSSDLALLGVSSNHPEISGLVRAGFLTIEESSRLYEKGVVGNVCGLHFNMEGDILEHSLNERTISISAEDLRAIPTRIGVAYGTRKADAIIGALRSGFINSLVTDTDAGMRILNLLKQ